MLLPTKTCTSCGRQLPVNQFRLRRAAGPARETRCRDCYNRWMRDYRRTKRSAAFQAFSAAVAREQSVRRIEQLCESMFRRFGGPERFADVWASEIKATLASGGGKPRAIKAMLAVMELQAFVEGHEPGNPYAQLTDDELREVLRYKLQDSSWHRTADHGPPMSARSHTLDGSGTDATGEPTSYSGM